MVGAFRQWSDGLRLNIALPSPSDARIRAGASLLGGGGGSAPIKLRAVSEGRHMAQLTGAAQFTTGVEHTTVV